MDGKEKAGLIAGVALGGMFAARMAARHRNAWSFDGKVALVTGGSRGLGLVLARQLACAGARTAVCARDSDELKSAQSDLLRYSPEILTLGCDLTDRRQVDAMTDRIREQWGPVDLLINNAGEIQVGPMEVMTPDDYERMMNIHFWGPLYATLNVLPDMIRRKDGRIVNVASIGGKISVPHLLPYCASKFALVGLSEGLRSALAKYRISVTTVCPGLMRTGSPPQATVKGKNEREYALFKIADSLPLLSMNADRAAHQILNACRHGEAEVVLTLPAEMASAFHGLFPGLTADILGWVNAYLPEPGGIGQEELKGYESQSGLSESLLTLLTDRAAQRNNEFGSLG